MCRQFKGLYNRCWKFFTSMHRFFKKFDFLFVDDVTLLLATWQSTSIQKKSCSYIWMKVADQFEKIQILPWNLEIMITHTFPFWSLIGTLGGPFLWRKILESDLAESFAIDVAGVPESIVKVLYFFHIWLERYSLIISWLIN
jgi:hypothetical protein